ncbi:MAG: diaminopimelate epimerase [Brevundimonas sp.]|jgi:diaminopimelate epimerase|uniref:diaminopimelate epimerase n=1 Tax=Brevundimonas sp. TaxID=1871086 RepID=UPI00391DD71C
MDKGTHAFVKMNGTGNDFVIVDALGAPFTPTPDQVRHICSRGHGVHGGCDQLIALEPARSDGAVFMRVWNSDGGVVETCGNALRCAGWLMMQGSGREQVAIETLAGTVLACRDHADAEGTPMVGVDMGRPRLDWREIPLAEEMDTRGIELQVGPIDDPVLHTPGAVSMGNPHVVFFTDRLDDTFVRATGSLIENHPLFPERVNVGFAHLESRARIRLRVWERGAGLTRACGTGACAALVASARRGLSDRMAQVVLDGGTLQIVWGEDDHVRMTGPVALEGSGRL